MGIKLNTPQLAGTISFVYNQWANNTVFIIVIIFCSFATDYFLSGIQVSIIFLNTDDLRNRKRYSELKEEAEDKKKNGGENNLRYEDKEETQVLKFFLKCSCQSFKTHYLKTIKIS